MRPDAIKPDPPWWQEFSAIPPEEKTERCASNLLAVFHETAEQYRQFVEQRCGGYEWAALSDCPSGEPSRLSFSDADLRAVYHWALDWFGGKDGTTGDRQLARRYWGLLYGWHDKEWMPGILAKLRFRNVTPMEEKLGRQKPEGGRDELDDYLIGQDFRGIPMLNVLNTLDKAGYQHNAEFLRSRVNRLFEKG